MKNLKKCLVLLLIACLLAGCKVDTGEQPTTEREINWTITQYTAIDDEMQCFYTMMSDDGDVIVIDGGTAGNEEIVRNILNGFGNRVRAWVLTRPDPGHIGAFMKIYENPGDIIIEKVYDAFIDWQRYDDYGNRAGRQLYQDYIALTKDDKRIVHVNRDAKFYSCGLEFVCYNAYDSYVEERTQDLSQDGSLMLKIKGKQNTFLYCSDVSADMEKLIIDQYGDNLKADYVQMSNHGNNGLSVDFYKIVAPKVAFFDARPSMYDQTNVPKGHRYDDYIEYFKEINTKVYDLKPTLNRVDFK